ncbi:MAG: DUF58 domain-containing protein [Candidatus Bathyarchaeota archaeon]|nr:DUF58 domain-containing protein [Candidatus Bathyarchaeota archaeon]
MPTINLKTAAAKTYLIAVIIVGMLVSPLPQLALAIALLAVQLYIAYKPPVPKINMALTFGTLVLAPLTLVPLLGSLSAFLMSPAVYLLDRNLRENASNQTFKTTKSMRTPTHTLIGLTAALGAVLVAALILQNLPLIFAGSILLIYLTAALTVSYRRIPQTPLKETKTWNRILVGETENTSINIQTEAKLPLTITIAAAQPWIRPKPEKLALKPKSQAQIEVTYTPPLAGPTKLQLQTIALDPWGLMQTNQTLQPVDLHIIPRAKYARWLAKKYLEQTASGAGSSGSAPPPRAIKVARSGVEFYGSRLYQPGDRLKNVDWKHTLMLDELIVKEYAGAQGTPTIIVADLTAKDAQSADKLIYNVVMAALTAATESLPSGLACFNRKEVLAATPPTNPRETLKKTLQITQKITVAEAPQKVMQPTDIKRLKRTIKGLSKTETEPSERFTEILEFEVEALQSATKMHPATEALKKCVERSPAPTMLTVASTGSGDTEALTVALEILKAKGYSIVTI